MQRHRYQQQWWHQRDHHPAWKRGLLRGVEHQVVVRVTRGAVEERLPHLAVEAQRQALQPVRRVGRARQRDLGVEFEARPRPAREALVQLEVADGAMPMALEVLERLIEDSIDELVHEWEAIHGAAG
jgi:hypothetical protein